MRNLDEYVKSVFSASTLQGKKDAFIELVNNSHAKDSTKKKAVSAVMRANSMTRIDSFAFNFAEMGEGNGVIK